MEPEKWKPIDMLYVGALIRSNWIFVLRDFIKSLKPFNTIGIYTGRSYLKNSLINFTIMGTKYIHSESRFTILVVSISALRLKSLHIKNLLLDSTFS